MLQSKSMVQKTHTDYTLFGRKIDVVKNHYINDDTIAFYNSSNLYVSSGYYELLKTDFDKAIRQPMKLIKIDDPLPDMSYEDLKKSFSFLNKMIDNSTEQDEKYSLINGQLRIIQLLKQLESSIFRYTRPIGNYSNHLTYPSND